MKTREVLLAGLSDRLGLHRDALAGNAARPKARGRGSPPISWRAGRHLMEWRFVRRSTIGIQEGASKQLWTGSGRLPAPSPFAVAADLLFPEPNPFLRDPVWVRYWILARLPLVGPAPYGQSVARQPLQRIRGIASASDPATLPWLRGAARTPPQNGRITRPTSPQPPAPRLADVSVLVDACAASPSCCDYEATTVSQDRSPNRPRLPAQNTDSVGLRSAPAASGKPSGSSAAGVVLPQAWLTNRHRVRARTIVGALQYHSRPRSRPGHQQDPARALHRVLWLRPLPPHWSRGC